MAKATRGSVVVRVVALLFALALAALAARLWLGSAPREPGGAEGADGHDAAEEEEAANEPPLHEPHSAEDQEALRDILRDEQPRNSR